MSLVVRSSYVVLNGFQVATTVVEMPSDAAVKLWDDDINKRIFDLMHSQNNVERLGGLLAIGVPLSFVRPWRSLIIPYRSSLGERWRRHRWIQAIPLQVLQLCETTSSKP